MPYTDLSHTTNFGYAKPNVLLAPVSVRLALEFQNQAFKG
jgi:hypothetical protein